MGRFGSLDNSVIYLFIDWLIDLFFDKVLDWWNQLALLYHPAVVMTTKDNTSTFINPAAEWMNEWMNEWEKK